MKKKISTIRAPQAIGPYSQAVEVDGWLYASGQIPIEPASGELVRGSAAEQAGRVLDNLTAVLDAAGLDWRSVVKTTVYLTDLADYPAVNEVYARYVGDPAPARACIQVSALPRGVAVEIDLIARGTT